MFVLLLRDIRIAHDEVVPVGRSENDQEIEDLLASEYVGQYIDTGHIKYYRKHGPLEWYEPPDGEQDYIVNVGNKKRWRAHSDVEYTKKILSIPEIGDLEHRLKGIN